MNKRFIGVLGTAVLALSATGSVLAQDTKTTTTTSTTVRQQVQNPDGSCTVIEYPVDKEVVVNLTPTTVIPGASGKAKILRHGDVTTVNLDVAGIAGDSNTLNLYAVDPSGAVTLLGPIGVNNGVASFTTTTPLDKFMLVVSPEGNLASITPETRVVLRSDVPQGMSIVPLARTGEGPGAPVGEKVAAVASSNYAVPMLNLPSYPNEKESEVHVNFADKAYVNRATFFITPGFNDKPQTRVKAKFHDLEEVNKDAFLTLWAVSPDGQFTRLGATRNQGNPNVATIDTDKNNTNVAWPDFGLFMTVEPNETVTSPSGPVVIRIAR